MQTMPTWSATVVLVDALDQLLADVAGEVEIDVRDAAAIRSGSGRGRGAPSRGRPARGR